MIKMPIRCLSGVPFKSYHTRSIKRPITLVFELDDQIPTMNFQEGGRGKAPNRHSYDEFSIHRVSPKNPISSSKLISFCFMGHFVASSTLVGFINNNNLSENPNIMMS